MCFDWHTVTRIARSFWLVFACSFPVQLAAQPDQGSAPGAPSTEPDPSAPAQAVDTPAPIPRESAPVAAPEPAPRAPPSEPPTVREARELTARAQERFEAGDYAAAAMEFSRAYELLRDDRRRARLLNNIAVCYERMFRYDRALEYYERYLRAGAIDARDRAEVEAVVRGLRELLGTLRISSDVPAEVWFDGRFAGRSPGELAVPAGTHALELRAPGHEVARRELRIAARRATALHVVLEALPAHRGLARHHFWSGIALTCAALVTGSGFGIAALRQDKTLERRHARDENAVTLNEKEHVQRLALAADVSFGVAALLGVSSTILFFLTEWDADVKTGASPTKLSFTPQLGHTHVGFSIAGRWP